MGGSGAYTGMVRAAVVPWRLQAFPAQRVLAPAPWGGGTCLNRSHLHTRASFEWSSLASSSAMPHQARAALDAVACLMEQTYAELQRVTDENVELQQRVAQLTAENRKAAMSAQQPY